MLQRIYRVKLLSHWPYEEILDVRVCKSEAEIDLFVDHHNAAFRIYRGYPHSYVQWALMINDSFYGDNEDLATGATELKDTGDDVWLYVNFTLFNSLKKSDDAQLEPLRTSLRTNGIASLKMPSETVCTDFVIRESPTDPFGGKAFNGTFKKAETNQLYVSDCENERMPIMNSGTIPDELASDFAFSYAGIVTFRPIVKIPSHSELLSLLDQYLNWFNGVLQGHPHAKNSRKSRR